MARLKKITTNHIFSLYTEIDEFVDLQYTNRLSAKCIASRNIFEAVTGIMLNRVTGSAPIKEHIDVPSCREYTHIVSLQKGSLGTIGWNEKSVEALRKRQ